MLSRRLLQGLYCTSRQKRIEPCLIVGSKRNLSFNDGGNEDNRQFIPKLMNMEMRLVPSLMHRIRNFFFEHGIIRPYFDPDFSKHNFLKGAKSAIEFVSSCIAEGDYTTLKESQVLTEDCLREIIMNMTLVSPENRRKIAVKQEDIQLNFIYQIGVMLEDDPKPTRHVEITYVAHVLTDDLIDSAENKEDMLRNAIGNQEYKNLRILESDIFLFFNLDYQILVNYRFIRNYTKGVEDSWTINALNHITLRQLLKQRSDEMN